MKISKPLSVKLELTLFFVLTPILVLLVTNLLGLWPDVAKNWLPSKMEKHLELKYPSMQFSCDKSNTYYDDGRKYDSDHKEMEYMSYRKFDFFYFSDRGLIMNCIAFPDDSDGFEYALNSFTVSATINRFGIANFDDRAYPYYVLPELEQFIRDNLVGDIFDYNPYIYASARYFNVFDPENKFRAGVPLSDFLKEGEDSIVSFGVKFTIILDPRRTSENDAKVKGAQIVEKWKVLNYSTMDNLSFDLHFSNPDESYEYDISRYRKETTRDSDYIGSKKYWSWDDHEPIVNFSTCTVGDTEHAREYEKNYKDEGLPEMAEFYKKQCSS